MVLQMFGLIVSCRRGWSKHPPATQKGSVYRTYAQAEYQRGYCDGIQKSRKQMSLALEHELVANANRDYWKDKYKGEIGQYQRTVGDLRKLVSDEAWKVVTQGRLYCAPETLDCNSTPTEAVPE